MKFNPGKTARLTKPDTGINSTATNRARVDDTKLERSLDALDPWLEVDYEPNKRDWLDQLGNTPVYLSPNEPISPYDCEKYPTSPFCGQELPFDPFDATEVLLDYKAKISPCEACIELQPKFMGLQMPPYMVCYRPSTTTELCNKPIEDKGYEVLPEEPNELGNIRTPPIAPPNHHRAVYSVSYTIIRHLSRETRLKPYILDSVTFTISPGQCYVGSQVIDSGETQWDKHPFTRSYTEEGGFHWYPNGYSGSGTGVLKYNVFTEYRGIYIHRFETRIETEEQTQKLQLTKKDVITFVLFDDLPCNVSSVYADILIRNTFQKMMEVYPFSIPTIPNPRLYPGHTEWIWYRGKSHEIGVMGYARNCPLSHRPPPSQPPPKDKDMDCCEDIMEMLELLHKRIGCDSYPMTLPGSLVQENDEDVITLESQAEVSAYLISNIDAVTGQYPIEIEIEDSDPTKEGNQRQTIKLPNQAETLAELFGLVFKTENTLDLLIEIVMKMIPELISVKNAAITAQSYAKANASYLGYQGNIDGQKVPCNFNVDTATSIQEFLTGKTYETPVYTDESKEDLQATLRHLLFAASIIKATSLVKDVDSESLLQSINQLATDEALSVPNKVDWLDWLQSINRDESRFNQGQNIKPQVTEENPLEGNNNAN
jgi:hypothetical protein